MHVENEAGPSRPRSQTPPALPPRPEPFVLTNVQTTHHDDSGIRDALDEIGTSANSEVNADQMMVDAKGDELYYRTYRGEEEDLAGVKRLIDQELSEPYVPSDYLVHNRAEKIDIQVS